jgi:hypothetical protein
LQSIKYRKKGENELEKFEKEAKTREIDKRRTYTLIKQRYDTYIKTKKTASRE